MARTRVSTTVDEELLASARQAHSALTDAALLDEALAALVAQHRSAEIDASYAAYDELPDIGRRPVVVLSRDTAIPRLRRTLIVPW